MDRCNNGGNDSDDVVQHKRKVVQSSIEQVIAKAIQDGTLHTKNWDLVPLVPVPTTTSTSITNTTDSVDNFGGVAGGGSSSYYGSHYGQQQQQPQPQQQFSTGSSYYGPSTSSSTSSAAAAAAVAVTGRRRKRWGQSPAFPSSAGTTSPATGGGGGGGGGSTNMSYYGPSSTSSSPSPSSPPSSFPSNSYFNSNPNSQNYYTNNNNNKNKKRGCWGDEDEDFLVLPRSSSDGGGKNKKHNKRSKTNSNYSTNNQGMDSSQEALSKRASRFGQYGLSDFTVNGDDDDDDDGRRQHDRFMGKGVIGGNRTILDESDYERMTVKGTCTVLEKEYLRLTAPPRAELVRPLAILEQHVKNLNDEYYEHGRKYGGGDGGGDNDNDNNNDDGDVKKKHDYLWFCSQFKAVRQDCTVQRIQGNFAIEVYESHARIALREGDLNEYNQCQTQLKELYDHKLRVGESKGTVNNNNNSSSSSSNKIDEEYMFEYEPHEEEFIAYRVLYYVYLSTNEKFSGGSGDMLQLLRSISQRQQRNENAISHALQVREAVAFGDYLSFFRLHTATPNLGMYLTSLLVPMMRVRALRRMAKAYRPSLDVSVCLAHLGFSTGTATTAEAAVDTEKTSANSTATAGDDAEKSSMIPPDVMKRGEDWLVSCGCVIDGKVFLTKDSTIHEPISATKNSLI